MLSATVSGRTCSVPAPTAMAYVGDGYEETSDGETDAVDVPEQSVSFEGKLRISNRHLGQLVATCVATVV